MNRVSKSVQYVSRMCPMYEMANKSGWRMILSRAKRTRGSLYHIANGGIQKHFSDKTGKKLLLVEYIKIILKLLSLYFCGIVQLLLSLFPPSQVPSQGTGNDRIMLHQKTFLPQKKKTQRTLVVLKRVKSEKMEKSCEHRLS